MEYVTATSDMAGAIYDVLHTAIETVYPKYYPKEVVTFFCNHHSKEHILDGIKSGNMGVLIDKDLVVGTGCFDGNHITGVYVLPAYQNQGYGSHIMDFLETEIAKIMIPLFWMHHLLPFVYTSTEVTKQWDMVCTNLKMM